MGNVVVLGVYHRLDNRAENLADDSPMAVELHNRRRIALHAALDNDPAIQVTNWGKTDDARPHEYVESVATAAASTVFQYAVVPGIKWLGRKLANTAVGVTLGELAKALVAKLRPKQDVKQILDFGISLPTGTRISVDPPERDATITIRFSAGSVESIPSPTDLVASMTFGSVYLSSTDCIDRADRTVATPLSRGQ